MATRPAGAWSRAPAGHAASAPPGAGRLKPSAPLSGSQSDRAAPWPDRTGELQRAPGRGAAAGPEGPAASPPGEARQALHYRPMTAASPCPTVTLDLGLAPRERYGALPAPAREASAALLADVLGQLPRAVRKVAALLRLRTRDRWQPELEALAPALGVAAGDLLLANVAYEVLVGAAGCSTLALATPAGPVLARNLDWEPAGLLARATCRIDERRGGARARTSAGWPGVIGAPTGLSSAGFAYALDAAVIGERTDMSGTPVLLHLRALLEEAEGFEDALERARDARLAASCLITLVGRRNDQRAVIERSPRTHAVRVAQGDAPLVATNHPLELPAATPAPTSEPFASSAARYERLAALATGLGDDPRDEALLEALADPGVRLASTCQHVIARPATDALGVWTPPGAAS